VAVHEHLFAWAQAEGLDFDLKREGILHIYRDKKSFDHAGGVSKLLDDETKLVTSRLDLDRFRVAGTAELNGYNKDIRANRIRPLVDWVNQCFPGINTRQVVPWVGLRTCFTTPGTGIWVGRLQR
jgi:hypothetical protein